MPGPFGVVFNLQKRGLSGVSIREMVYRAVGIH